MGTESVRVSFLLAGFILLLENQKLGADETETYAEITPLMKPAQTTRINQ